MSGAVKLEGMVDETAEVILCFSYAYRTETAYFLWKKRVLGAKSISLNVEHRLL